ncbi:response regulator transcription factor [Hominifimenecus sp. rT4P-3]|uniref:response regulator transcription factor n=1 Tax=Hominifimenecus sp. rT4P-3 TaxID=3242979 RepID=UPI003DA4DCB1
MRILLIDDDPRLCDSLSFELKKEGFSVDICNDGEDALPWIRQSVHDLILLDRMMPGIDGLSLLKKIRAEGISTPVILLTALGELSDKVTGLENGADDYMVKPIAFPELLARIHSISRRPRNLEVPGKLTLGDLAFDPVGLTLDCGSFSCTLSKREADLLEIFLKNPGQTLPRNLLLSRVWGPDAEVEDGNLDNYIHFLRRRLKTIQSSLQLKTVRGIGYLLEVTDV